MSIVNTLKMCLLRPRFLVEPLQSRCYSKPTVRKFWSSFLKLI